MKVETHEAVDLDTSGAGWVTLDRRLAAALTKIPHGQLGRQLTLASNSALHAGRVAIGRVLLQLVFSYHSSGQHAELMYDIDHI